MKKVIVSLLSVFILIMFIPSINVYASDYDASDYGYEEYEDYADGDTEKVYTWVQEGDAKFCYINNGGWSEADMLVGWHTIDGETYYFYSQEMVDARYGQMATGEVWIGDWTFYFDEEGHLYDWKQGLE